MVSVLIVEDESIVAKDIRKRLQNLGYTVSAIASSGKEALQKAKDNPDVVLMDIVLKGDMDGIEAAEHIRTGGIPVIYVTAYADDKTLQRAKITEPYGYILKPFEDRELHTVIEMALYKHEMEKKLRESQQWLATTLKSIGDGVVATDTRGLITFMNPVAENLTGWAQQEAVGNLLKDVFTIIDEETREGCENPFEKILEAGRIIDLSNNTILVAKDGTERIVTITGAPIRDETYNTLGTVLVFNDVTEKRRIEQELLKTQKLESLSILAGGVAHDFNNILTAILGNANLAKMYAANEKVTEKLTKIERASLQAKELTQQLLTFSKGGAPTKKTTSITELIKDSTGFALRGSNVRCHFYLSDDLWPVDVDAGQISQVINNIIMNADQAMPDGGIIIVRGENVTIQEHVTLQKGNYVKISIKDEGAGIPEKYVERIFEPYFTTKQKGSGLGLATCYSIIKNHDGLITAESELGVGTTFYMWLPASQEKREEKEEPEEVPKGEGKVLLMDDEESILEAAGEVLQYLGYTVVTARDGSEAVEQYRKVLDKEPFDVVIIDLTIPGGMGGKKTIEKLLEIDPHVKAVVSSGYSNDPIMANYGEYGFCGVVTKPYTIKELSETLHKVLHEE
ncbi:MAG: response regulator [Theionarchaea archaeon]|nr:response regulator [Theionarchaea archaeon]